MPAAAHAASVHAPREPMTEAVTKAVTETVARAVVEMVEALHNDDRRGEAKKPRRSAPNPNHPNPNKERNRDRDRNTPRGRNSQRNTVNMQARGPHRLAAAIPEWFA